MSADEKLEMGITLNCALLAPELIPTAPALPAPPEPKKPRIAIAAPSCSVEANKENDDSDQPPPPAPTMAVAIPEDNREALAPIDGENEVPVDFDLLEILSEAANQNEQGTSVVPAGVNQAATYSNTQINVKNSPKIPAFHNCHIGTINVNIIQK